MLGNNSSVLAQIWVLPKQKSSTDCVFFPELYSGDKQPISWQEAAYLYMFVFSKGVVIHFKEV